MKLLFAKGNSARKEKYKVNTAIYEKESGEIFVRKYAVSKKAFGHIKQLSKTPELIKKCAKGINIPKIIRAEKTYVDFKYLPFPSLEQLIENCLLNRRFKQSAQHLFRLNDFVSKLKTVKTNPYNNILFTKMFDPSDKYKHARDEDCFIITILDLNHDNILVDKHNKLYLVDLEWIFDFPMPAPYIQLRPLFYLSLKLQPLIASLVSDEFPCYEILQEFLIPKIWFDRMPLSQTVIKKYLFYEGNVQRYINAYHNLSDQPKLFSQKNLISKRTLPNLNTYIKHTNSIAKKNAELVKEVKETKRELLNHQQILSKITSARFFKLWQKYCRIRDSVLDKNNRH